MRFEAHQVIQETIPGRAAMLSDRGSADAPRRLATLTVNCARVLKKAVDTETSREANMTDYDRRNGGPRGGYNNRKRRHRGS